MSVGTARAIAAAVPRSPGSDIQSSGSGYGSAQANAFKQTPAYRQAVVHTFLAQSGQQQHAILQGALKMPSLEGHILAGYLNSEIPTASGLGMKASLGPGVKINIGPSVLGQLGKLLKYSPIGGAAAGSGTSAGGGILGSATMFGGAAGAEHILKAAGSDAVNFVPNTVQGLYGMGSQLAQGHPANALGMLVDPYVNMIEHPVSSFYNHPLNTAMMLGGPEAMAGRAAGSVARSGVLGNAAKAAADTTRAPLRLGADIAGAPNPLVEARSYSPNVITKGVQVMNEARLRRQGIDPNVARPKVRVLPAALANSLNVGLEVKTRQLGDRAVAFERMMKGKEDRTVATATIRAARPHKSVENIVPHILQGIVRTPETAVEDLTKEINRLRAADTGARTAANFANRAQVRDLTAALHSPHLGDAFKSANTVRDFLHAQDAYAVDKGLLPPEMAQRSRVLKYAMAHMGATYDHTRGEFVDHTGAPLSTQAILDHIAGKRTSTVPNPKYAKLVEREAKARAMIHGAQTTGEYTAANDALARLTAARQAEPKDRVITVSNGPKMPDPAYVGHYPAKQATFRFYKRWQAARGSLTGHKLTGAAFHSGNYDHTYDALVAQSARTQEALTHAGFHDYLVNHFGIKKPASLQHAGENGYYTPNEGRALAHASQFNDDGTPRTDVNPLVPMTAFNAKTPLAAIQHLQSPADLQHVDGLELDAIRRAIADAARPEDGVRNVVMMPHALVDQVSKQVKPAGDVGRAIGQYTQQFKRTVLPYSTHWMGQIASEAVLRGLVAGVIDPRNVAAGRQLMKVLTTTEEGRSALREMVNAHFYNKNDPLAKFNPNPNALVELAKGTPVIGKQTIPLPGGRPVLRTAAAKLRGKDLPAPRPRYVPGLIGAHTIYADRIGAAMGGLERQFRIMGLGKVARQQLQEFTKSYQAGIGLQARNLELLASKLTTDPALVTRFGRQIEDIFGKYNALSPKVRAATQTAVPFLPWYLNAAKFVLWTLPVKHPLASSLAAALRQTIANDVANGKQEPLTPYQEQALAKFTPGGIFPQPGPYVGGPLGEAAATATGAFLPQISGALYEMLGRNSFGDAALKGPGGVVAAFTGPARAAAAEAALEAILPGAAKLRTVLEGGGTPYGTSTLLNPQTKPGTGSGVSAMINRLFNPLRAFQSASTAASSGAAAGRYDFSKAGGASVAGGRYDFSHAGGGTGKYAPLTGGATPPPATGKYAPLGQYDFSQAGG